MDNDIAEDITFLAGFNDFWNTEFPKTCLKCGTTYGNFSELVSKTSPADNASGLMAYEDDDHETSVGIFRNCACGSTLMIKGHDRRDTSEAGEKRRKIFGDMLDKLIAAKVPREVARKRLLRMLYSGQIDDLANRLLGPV